MSADCFGNPTPFPPHIADTYADIKRFGVVPFDVRMDYLDVRRDAMVGRAAREDAWDAYWNLCLLVEQAQATEVAR